MRSLALTGFGKTRACCFFITILLASAGFFSPAWSEERIAVGDLVWEVHLATAREMAQEDLVIPKEIENARGALEKLAEKSHFREFDLHKSANLPCQSTKPIELAWDSTLKFSFFVTKDKEKSYLEAAWLRREDGSTEKYEQIGGKVKKAFQPTKSLVLLGPRVEHGTAMAVLHLEPAPALTQHDQ